ncbi:hypothetical protein KIN20_019362 [Parelaphostrongylus tenuis]|uniref:Uncharacterized protein n=1 Tax=Parelaphostrongylus tenuis TaxID=148309 RepID=A0AAD5QSU2_PARTN|nr:hypothetical protein KIN20_019362 [Parelaphostrongylus tenuis]
MELPITTSNETVTKIVNEATAVLRNLSEMDQTMLPKLVRVEVAICIYNARALAYELTGEEFLMQPEMIGMASLVWLKRQDAILFMLFMSTESNCSLKHAVVEVVGSIGVLVKSNLIKNIDLFEH